MRRRDSLSRTWVRPVWWSVTAALTLLGLAGGYLRLGTAHALLLVGVGGGFSGFAAWVLQPPTGRRPARGALTAVSLVGGVVLLAVTGTVVQLGGVGVVLALAVAVTGCLLGPRRHGGGGHTSAPASPRPTDVPALEILPPDPLPAVSALGSLDTAALCWTWRVSYTRLLASDCPGTREYLVELRRSCLLELERRDPAAFRRWVPTARAASDPARFFCHQPQR